MGYQVKSHIAKNLNTCLNTCIGIADEVYHDSIKNEKYIELGELQMNVRKLGQTVKLLTETVQQALPAIDTAILLADALNKPR